MAPYYDHDGITIYHGDCREVLPLLIPGFDLLLTDPPYGISYKSNRGSDHAAIVGDDDTLDVPAVLAQAARLLRRSRHAYIFGDIDLSSTALTAKVELVWDKGVVGMGDLSLPWSTSHEPITFAVYEPSIANREKGYGRLAARMRKGSVLRCIRTNGQGTNRHPTEKPVEVLRQLIESSSVLGETVLDPFMGVGSTLVAAHMEGRNAVGIETDERYCEIAASRLGVQVAQGVLL